jgi:heat shock protein HspQ
MRTNQFKIGTKVKQNYLNYTGVVIEIKSNKYIFEVNIKLDKPCTWQSQEFNQITAYKDMFTNQLQYIELDN